MNSHFCSFCSDQEQQEWSMDGWRHVFLLLLPADLLQNDKTKQSIHQLSALSMIPNSTTCKARRTFVSWWYSLCLALIGSCYIMSL